MSWTPEARIFFQDWYVNLEREGFTGPVAAYLERKQDHMLRLAIILQLTLTNDMVIAKETMERALAILNTIETETNPMVEYVSTEPRMRSAQTILELLRHHPKGLPESKLLSLCWRQLSHPREFDEIIGMLVKSRTLKILQLEGGLGYGLNS